MLGSEKGLPGSDLFSDKTDIGVKLATFKASMALSFSLHYTKKCLLRIIKRSRKIKEEVAKV